MGRNRAASSWLEGAAAYLGNSHSHLALPSAPACAEVAAASLWWGPYTAYFGDIGQQEGTVGTCWQEVSETHP